MSNICQTWFISDLHLQPKCPEITQRFCLLLDKLLKEQVDSLYILGDLFEVWVGDDDSNDFHEDIMGRLASLTKAGLAVHILPGNRDFLMGKAFFKKTGSLLLNEPSIINLYGERVLVSHGDTLCTLDKRYMRARKWLRHPFIKACFLSLPLSLRKQIANKMRNQSKHYMKNIPDEIMDVNQATVLQQMAYYNVDFLIHGHTHRPHIHEFTTPYANQESKKRIVLAAWHQQGHFLRWKSSSSFEMVYF